MTQLEASTQYTVTMLVTHGVTALGLWLAVTQVVDVTSLGYLVAALSVGIGFGLQEIISNFVSGLILLLERPLKPGDTIEFGAGSVGEVRELGIRATTIRTADNIHVLVPNRELVTQRVVNHDAIDPRIRVTIQVGAAYGSDTKLVRQVLEEAAARDGRVLEKPAPEVFLLEFADSALQFMLACWVADAKQRFQVASDLRFAIDAAFRRAGLAMPFPQRDVWLRSERPLRIALEHDSGRPRGAE
jgi:potassium efflux system protein